jgi:hypothetical protein
MSHHLAFINAEADIVQDIGLHIAFLIAFAQVVALQFLARCRHSTR